MRRESTPDYSLGFIDEPHLVTFLKALTVVRAMPERDARQWLSPIGASKEKASNSLALLEDANIIEFKEDKYQITTLFLKKTHQSKVDSALRNAVLESIDYDELKLFMKHAQLPDASSIVWNPSSISPFQLQLRDLFISLKIIHLQHDYLRASKILVGYLQSIDLIDYGKQTTKLVTNDELLYRLDLKRGLGEEAEKVAYEHELNRIASFGKLPMRISTENVAAGYDIESYENESSLEYDRHIEVKYYNNGHFYISKNEMEVAKRLGNRYWIYLVTVSSSGNHRVEKIRGAYTELLRTERWARSTEVYLISPQEKHK